MKLIINCILLMSLMSHSATSQEFNIAVGEWPPYITSERSDRGPISKLMHDIFTDIGYKVNINFYPWARVYEKTAKGEQHATGVWMHKLEREKDFYYSDPVLQEQFVFFHLKTKKFNWDQYTDLDGIRIAGLLESSYGEGLNAMIEQKRVKLKRLPTHKQGFEMLLRGRVDVVALEKNVGISTIQQYFNLEDIERITYHKKPFLNNMSYVLFPRKRAASPKILKKFNSMLKQYKKSGKYQQYMDQIGRVK